MGICSSAEYAAPMPRAERDCRNRVDDDGDGRVDCLDSDCAGESFCSGAEYMAPMPVRIEADCSDGKDNDGDGYTDRADPDCAPPSVALYAAPMR
jgi:hypothetical protein